MTCLSKCSLLVMLVSPISIANTLLDELSMCAKNNDSLQRLVCYDKLAKDKINSPPKQQQITLKDIIAKRVDRGVKSVQKKQPEAVLAFKKPLAESAIVEPKSDAVIANAAQQQQATFGKENSKRPADSINQIKANVIKIQKAPYGDLIITLENGQVWRQTDGSHFRLSKDEVVIIERGALGSFFIGKEDTKKRIRAKRLK
ncbi:MAG: hypothetical protein ACI936_001336 [Paraglaciecola sp.]|jgi:hypothetical protein